MGYNTLVEGGGMVYSVTPGKEQDDTTSIGGTLYHLGEQGRDTVNYQKK